MAPSPERDARVNALHEHKRKVILDAARRGLARDGASGLTIRGVAAEAGYVPGAVYFYFASKDELIAELVIQDLGALTKRLRAIADATSRAQEAVEALASPQGSAGIEELLAALGATGLNPERERALNGRLIAFLSAIGETTARGEEASARMLAAGAGLVGLALLQRGARLQKLGVAWAPAAAVLTRLAKDS